MYINHIKSNTIFQLCKNIHITEIITIYIFSANYVITPKLTWLKYYYLRSNEDKKKYKLI